MRALERKGVEDSYELLTTREREILQLLAEGKSNKEVANMLNLSLYTVETHRTHILQKLNLHTGYFYSPGICPSGWAPVASLESNLRTTASDYSVYALPQETTAWLCCPS